MSNPAAAPLPPFPDRLLSLHRLQQILLLVLMLVGLFGTFMILRPFLHPIILGALLACVFAPVHSYFLRLTRQRKNLAALLACMSVALVVVLPLGAFTTTLVYRGVNAFNDVQSWLQEGNLALTIESERAQKILQSRPVTRLVEIRDKIFPDWTLDTVKDWLVANGSKLVGWLNEQVLSVLGNAALMIVNFIIMLFVMFYFFRDGADFMNYLIRLSPLSPAHEQLLINRVKSVTKAAISGTILTGVAQAVLAMIAFAIVGIPWLVWGVMLGMASLVPLVGTALIWVPCVLYLLVKTDPNIVGAIFLAVWCIVVVGLADNFLRPWLMQGETGMSSLILFFAILGGIKLFNLKGIIYGPLIFGLCAVMLYIYELEMVGPIPPAAETAAQPGRRRRKRRRRHRDDSPGREDGERPSFDVGDDSPETRPT